MRYSAYSPLGVAFAVALSLLPSIQSIDARSIPTGSGGAMTATGVSALLPYSLPGQEEPDRIPSITIVSPENNAFFPADAEIRIQARASDELQGESFVQFKANGTVVGGSFLTGQNGDFYFEFLWDPPISGTYQLIAEYLESAEVVTISDPVEVTVQFPVPNVPPSVTIDSPIDGATFVHGSYVTTIVTASDPDGTIRSVEIFANETKIWNVILPEGGTGEGTWRAPWRNMPPGRYLLTARVTDDRGAVTTSSVWIFVQLLIAQRELPLEYYPGHGFTVRINADAKTPVKAYAVEDQPPAGWSVSDVSHSGQFDPQTGRVKFGPFFDNEDRTLTYVITPPETAVGIAEFTGVASANGFPEPIGLYSEITGISPFHPADAPPEDSRITIHELTAYATAWRESRNWPRKPYRIPVAFVTAAGAIWNMGEAYEFVPPLPPPECWRPLHQQTSPAALNSVPVPPRASPTAKRQLSELDGAVDVLIQVQGASSASCYALEEQTPAGWQISQINADGVAGPDGVIRWGPFLDRTDRTFTYRLTAAGSQPAEPSLQGVFAHDLQQLVIGNAHSHRLGLSLAQGEPKILLLHLSEPLASEGLLESADSVKGKWTLLNTLPVGIQQTSIPMGEPQHRAKFYRVRIKD